MSTSADDQKDLSADESGGKHFPSYGNLDFLGSTLDMPIITETLEQLSLSALVPFRNAIQAGLDAIFVGGRMIQRIPIKLNKHLPCD